MAESTIPVMMSMRKTRLVKAKRNHAKYLVLLSVVKQAISTVITEREPVTINLIFFCKSVNLSLEVQYFSSFTSLK